jgi:hypothetical protein
MRDSPRLDWSVPTDAWGRLREYVQNEFGGLDGYLARETEKAMREYADLDGYDGVEERVAQLYEAAGYTSSGQTLREKNFSDGRTRVAVRVDEHVADDFRRFVDESDSSNPYGVELAKAVRVYLDGGRAARLERRLDDILDDVEAALQDPADETNEDDGKKMYSKDRKVIRICRELNDQFTGAELDGVIRKHAGWSDDPSDATIESYRDLVLERLDVRRHPYADDEIWMPTENFYELVPEDVPEECVQPVSQLDHDDRIWRVIYAVGRRAAKHGGRASSQASTVREEIFNEEVTVDKCMTYLEEAASYDGVELERTGEEATVKVNLHVMAEHGGAEVQEILDYRDADADPLLGELTETTVTDFTDGASPKADDPDAAIEALEQAAPTSADGGADSSRLSNAQRRLIDDLGGNPDDPDDVSEYLDPDTGEGSS